MRLQQLHIGGFGKLTDRRIEFDEGLNVVYGKNEAGKSTLTNALVASLYGVGRNRDMWRPWSGAPYATNLRYTLSDGRTFEVARDFERDPKSVIVYDENGNDVSTELTIGKVINPGHAHLKIPLEVFINAAYVAEGAAEIDGSRAERISTALAHALDGGPREDAALGAVQRLDEALATHVGTKRATVNAPLKHINDEIEEVQRDADELRGRLRELDGLRGHLEEETASAAALEHALNEHDRQFRAHRAHAIDARLRALSEVRDTIASLHEERAQYEDVAAFPAGALAQVEKLHSDWRSAEAVAKAAAETASEMRMTPALEAELAERMRDGGSLDERSFADLEQAVKESSDARLRATYASNEVQTARRSIEGGNEIFGAAFASGAFVALGAIVLAILHLWIFTAIGMVVGGGLLAVAALRWSKKRAAQETISKMERAADAATQSEVAAATRVAAVLESCGVPSFEEFIRRRERARELLERRTEAQRQAERATLAATTARNAGKTFDEGVRGFVTTTGDRDADLARVRALDARKTTRDGIDLQLSMLDVRRNDLLAEDDEFALEAELQELRGEGVIPAAADRPRNFIAERADLERRCNKSRTEAASLAAELRTAEAQLGDLAALDERSQTLTVEREKLERFESAVCLARRIIEERTREAHQKFARRLTDYASKTFDGITLGRYTDVRVDPTTLKIRVRAPETGAIVDLSSLSSGTREQAYLVVRLAMVRMFAEGMETAPLLLDDPFAHWDEGRIARSFPILEAGARDVQTILFTTQSIVAQAATAHGARRIDLDDVQVEAVPALLNGA